MEDYGRLIEVGEEGEGVACKENEENDDEDIDCGDSFIKYE